MRLHHLSMTAFGPFAASETLDFDALNDAGLFLLSGPTGGGKSSILDAVCFALYGQTPGVRDVKGLKSQHAADPVAPEVVLEFSIGGRRFEVRRTPEWSRPKKRGDGVVRQHASASLTRIDPEGRTLVSSRIQEVGHEISELIGMTLDQFEQVVLLPQGEFQTFLRASSQERHDVLQQLFKTHRFAHIEQWVHTHSRELKVTAEGSAAAVRRLVDAVADRTGAEPPESLETPLSWTDDVLERLRADLLAARTADERARQQAAQARSVHDEAVRVVAARERADAAHRVLAELADQAPSARAATDALAADARATQCLPVLDLLDNALATLAQRETEHRAAVEGLDPADAAEPAAAEDGLRQRLATLRAALPRLLAHDQARHAERLARAEAERCASALAELTEGIATMPEGLERLRDELAAAEVLAASRETAALAVTAARTRHDAAARLPELERDRDRARRAHLDAREAAAGARDTLQETVERRLAGIAAELAGRLTAGEPCLVCGSTDHPAPAAPRTDSVDEAQQAAASAAYDAARSSLEVAAERLREVEARTEATRTAAGGIDEPTAAEQMTMAQGLLEKADRAVARQAELRERLVARKKEHDEAVARHSALSAQVAQLDEAAAGHARIARAAAQDVSAAWGDQPPPESWEGHLEELERRRTTVVATRATQQALDQAATTAAELEDRARSSVLGAGFISLDDARAAVLDDDRRVELTTLLESRRETEVAARAVLADVAETAGADQPTPDLTLLAERLAEADRVATTSAASVLTVEQTIASATASRSRLEQALADWRPAQTQADRAEAIADLVRGTGPHNQLQMRLSSYVLATRLDQVVAAANERLTHMRDHRYLLRRTGRAARRNAQAGLGLEVVDQWTGSSRDPKSLSGGETFVVSLALALGLADVVSDEAGGVEVATLFVDEGFGSLDADTLDDVMDRLDGLRAGGRTVGVVSHVAELRNRIPTQVHVEKRRDGSSVRVRTLAG